ncbi:MAG: TlpA family protein disulfide reductase [Acidobacteria bacterium]|nr:TlpA family protein disulfide reductase [Acidobacteriota bacterium]MBK8813952.1 TlpA family protein disulfide reductase [Acidobacteriota bacterium]
MKFTRSLQVSCLILAAAAGIFAQQNKPLAENFSGATLDGQTVELEALRGKVVVMTFWSTKCAICVSEIPKLNQIAANYKEKDVVFLGLTTDNPTLVESFVKNRPFNFNLMPGSFGVLLKYADRDRAGNLNMGFPAYFVINQTGEIELKASGWDKTNAVSSQVNRLLATGQAKVE